MLQNWKQKKRDEYPVRRGCVYHCVSYEGEDEGWRKRALWPLAESLIAPATRPALRPSVRGSRSPRGRYSRPSPVLRDKRSNKKCWAIDCSDRFFLSISLSLVSTEGADDEVQCQWSSHPIKKSRAVKKWGGWYRTYRSTSQPQRPHNWFSDSFLDRRKSEISWRQFFRSKTTL